MCNCDHDFDNLIPKHCHKYTLMDKIVMGFIFTCLAISTIALLLTLIDPRYFYCQYMNSYNTFVDCRPRHALRTIIRVCYVGNFTRNQWSQSWN